MNRCPFCGGSGVVKSGTLFFKVECDNCGASTKYCSSRKDAIDLWNMRDDDEDKVEDSWDRLEDEATLSPCVYTRKVLCIDTSYYGCDAEMMAQDLVRRAKRLANKKQI